MIEQPVTDGKFARQPDLINPFLKSALLLMFVSNIALAAPSHFSVVIGSALACRDQVSAAYFNEYMNTHFGPSAFTAGGANWWKVDGRLFNADVQYIFVGSDRDFIGATYKDNPDILITKLKDVMGIGYKQSAAEKWVAETDSVIIRYYDDTTPSKMYCIGAPHTPN